VHVAGGEVEGWPEENERQVGKVNNRVDRVWAVRPDFRPSQEFVLLIRLPIRWNKANSLRNGTARL